MERKEKGRKEKINYCLAISNSKTMTYIIVAGSTLLLTLN